MELGQLAVSLLFDDTSFSQGVSRTQATSRTLSNSLTGLASTLNRTLVGGFAAAAAGATAFVGASLAIGAQFDKEITVVRALLNASEEDFARLSARARELGATTEFTATQAATGLQNFARAGLSVDQSIAAVGPALSLATAAAADLDLATASVAATLAQFQLDAAESSRVADVLANAAASTKFDLEGLTVALRRAGPAGNALGLSLEETVSAISQFRNLGLEASQSGRVFEAVLKRLARPPKAARDAIEELGLSIEDLDPEQVPFDQLLVRLREAGAGAKEFGAIFGLFGLQIQGVAQTVDAAEGGFEDLAEQLRSGVGRASELATQQSQNLLTQLQILRSGVEEVFLSVFDAIREPALQVLGSIIELVQEISRQFRAGAGDVEDSAQRVADAISGFLDQNREQIAETFVNLAQGAAELTEAVIPLIRALGELTPLIVDLLNVAADNPELTFLAGAITSLGLSLVSLVGPITSVITALSNLGVTFGSLTSGFTGFATALGNLGPVLVSTTGGLGAIAAAATGAIAVVIDLIDKQRQAAREARLQAAEQEALAAQQEQSKRATEALTGALEAQRAEFAELADQGFAFDEGQRALLQATDNFDATATAAAIAAGEVVRLGDSFVATSDLLQTGGEAGVSVLREQNDEIRGQAEQFREAARALREFSEQQGDTDRIVLFDNQFTRDVLEQSQQDALATLDTVTNGIEGVADLQARIQDRAAAQGITIRQAQEQELAVFAARAEAQAEALETRARASEERITNFQAEENQKRADAFINETERAEQEATAAATTGAQQRVNIAQEASNSIRSILDREQTAAQARLPRAQQIRAAFEAEIAEIDNFVTQVRDAAGAQSSELVAAEEDAAQARLLARQRLNTELADLARESSDELTQLAQQSAQQLAQEEITALGDREQILARGTARIEGIREASAREQAAIETALRAELDAINLGEVDDEVERARRVEQARTQAADRLAALAVRTNGRIVRAQEDVNDDLIDLDEQRTRENEQQARERVRIAEQEAQAVRDLGRELVDGFTRGPDAFSLIGDQLTSALGQLATSVDETGERTENTFGRVVRGLGTVVRTASNVAQTTFRVVTGIANQIVNLFDSVTGGFVSGLNPLQIVGDITNGLVEAEQAVRAARDAIEAGTGTVDDLRDAQRALAEERRRVESGEAGREAVSDLADRAIAFTEALSASLGPLLRQLATELPDVIASATEGLTDAFSAIADNIPAIADAIIEGADGFVQAIVDGLPDVANALISTIGRSSRSLFNNIGVLIEGLLDNLSGLLDNFITQIPESLGALNDLIGTIVENVVANIGDILLSIVQGISEVIGQIPDLLGSIADGLLRGLADLTESIPDNIVRSLEGAAEDLTNFLVSVVETVLETALSGVNIVADLLINTISTTPEVTQDLVRAFFEIFTEALGLLGPTIGRTIFNFFDGEGNVGERLGRAFGEGAEESLTEFFQGIGDLFSDTFRISEEQFAVVADFFTNLWEGIKQEFDELLIQPIRRLFEQVRDFFNNLTTGGFLGGLFGNSNEGAQGGIDFVQRAQGIIVHPGEAVLTAQQNAQRLGLTGVTRNPTAPVQRDGAFTPNPGRGGMGPMQINVNIGGDQIARTMVDLERTGGAAVTNRLTRKKTRTRVGLKTT